MGYFTSLNHSLVPNIFGITVDFHRVSVDEMTAKPRN